MEKVLRVVNKNKAGNDFAYWKTKSFQDRINAIEILRLQFIQLQKDVQQRLQRIYTIVNRKSG